MRLDIADHTTAMAVVWVWEKQTTEDVLARVLEAYLDQEAGGEQQGAPFVTRDPSRCGGAPTMAGTRVGVHDVVSYAAHYGEDLGRVREEALPHLSLEQLRTAMAWYRENRTEIDDLLRRRREEYERLVAEANAAK
jgi:uncharacterized protein (DUF433 family)